MPMVKVDLAQVEHNSDALIEAHIELADATGLNAIERCLVLARIAYIYEQSLKRSIDAANLAEYERARQVLIQRAEDTRAQNVVEQDTRVNADGGEA